ncbi:MAG: hypothetical protein BWK80_04765 [Desulfobacteraceae bacterium IS3]|nr:MAG: hypothetical protein BWK80_04765 [Desulfobacteraceae bacterium IS3]
MKDLENKGKIYRLSDDFVLYCGHSEEERFLLFNIKNGKIYRLNKVSYSMLELFDGILGTEDIFSLLSKRFNVGKNHLKTDLYRMIDEWTKRNILI